MQKMNSSNNNDNDSNNKITKTITKIDNQQTNKQKLATFFSIMMYKATSWQKKKRIEWCWNPVSSFNFSFKIESITTLIVFNNIVRKRFSFNSTANIPKRYFKCLLPAPCRFVRKIPFQVVVLVQTVSCRYGSILEVLHRTRKLV